VRHSHNWHVEGNLPVRAEDVIVAAMVQLQRVASESADAFHVHKNVPGDASQDDHLRSCNGKLSQWMDTWQHEMRRAGGDQFHYAFLNLFRLHIRLFLNSFALQASMSPSSQLKPNAAALSACYSVALEMLQIVVRDFATTTTILKYSQDSVTVMTAYAAVFLLKLLRSPTTTAELHEGAAEEIHTSVFRVAQAYHDISQSSVMVSAAQHARFLRGLVEEDRARLRMSDPHRRAYGSPSDSYRGSLSSGPPEQPEFKYQAQRLPGPLSGHPPPSHLYSSAREADLQSNIRRGTSADKQAYPSPSPSHSDARPPPPPSESDQHYWKNMFRDLGFNDGMEGAAPSPISGYSLSTSPAYGKGMPASNSGLLPPLNPSSSSRGKPAYGLGERSLPHPNVHGYNADHAYHQPPYPSMSSSYPHPPSR